MCTRMPPPPISGKFSEGGIAGGGGSIAGKGGMNVQPRTVQGHARAVQGKAGQSDLNPWYSSLSRLPRVPAKNSSLAGGQSEAVSIGVGVPMGADMFRCWW